MEKWYLIVNPAGGRGAVQRKWPAIEAALRALGFDYTYALTTHRRHATALARAAVEQGYRKIMAIGGDGTNNEVINGLMQQEVVPGKELCYALLPVGTGNDWIRTHGIPKNSEQVLAMIKAGHTMLHDIGRVEYQTSAGPAARYFINIAGMAYDAFLVRYIEEKNPRGLSKIYYFSMILRCLFMYRLKRARVWFDGQEEEAKYYTINVGVCRYSGGGMQFVPHAEPTSGRLALTLVRSVSKLGVLMATPYFYEGRIRRHPKAALHEAQEVRVTHVDPEHPVLVEVDGEFLGHTPVRYSVLPGALRVVVPERS